MKFTQFVPCLKAVSIGKDSPDINADSVVNILDLVVIANAFDG